MAIEVKKKLDENVEIVEKTLGAGVSFDILTRKFKIAQIDAALIFIDGFIKDEMVRVMNTLMDAQREEIAVNPISKILEMRLPYFEVSREVDLEKVIQEILAGQQALFLDGHSEVILIDARTWQIRTPEEPELEKATRGPAEGFVETMLTNVNLLRRRLRDPKFRAEVVRVGKRSRTDVAIVYIDDIIDKGLVRDVKKKLEELEVDGLPLGDKTIEEFLTGGSLNPLPKVRYTERPDTAAAHILEGHLVIIVDTTPTALILPAPFLAHLKTLEEYRQGPVMGTYLIFIRMSAVLIALLLPPLWLLFALHSEYLPEFLEFIGPKKAGTINLGLQFILASLGIDLIRMASIRTPNALATSLGVIGALVLGEFATKVGLFSPEVVFYMAIAALCSFAIPGYELALTIKLFRFGLLILVSLLGLPGLIGGLIIVFLMLLFTKSFGVPYLWPLIPFNYSALKSFLLRQTIMDLSEKRPSALNPGDTDRMDKNDKTK